MDAGFSGFRQYEAGAWNTAALHYRSEHVSMAALGDGADHRPPQEEAQR